MKIRGRGDGLKIALTSSRIQAKRAIFKYICLIFDEKM